MVSVKIFGILTMLNGRLGTTNMRLKSIHRILSFTR